MFESKETKPAGTSDSSNNLVVFKVYAADQILAGKYFQGLLDKIKTAANLSEQHYEMLYKPLIHALADYVQVFSIAVGAKADCSCLAKGLRRGYEMLKIAKNERHPQPDLFNYLCFSAGLLINIHNIARNNRVVITNSAGHFNYLWNPMLGSLISQGAEYYRTRVVTGLFPAVAEALVVLLAQQLMPERAYAWVTEDDQLFADWLLLLQDPEHARGDLANIHSKFKSLFPDFDSIVEASGFNIDIDIAEDLSLGEDFVNWLKERLKAGNIDVNATDASVHMIAEGAFLEIASLAREYSELHGGQINVSDITRQFRLMFGIFQDRRGPMGYMVDFLAMTPEAQQRRGAFAASGFSSPHTRTVVSGIVMRDSAVLFEGRTPPGSSKNWGPRSAQNLQTSLPSTEIAKANINKPASRG